MYATRTILAVVAIVGAIPLLVSTSKAEAISNPSFEEEHDGTMPNGQSTAGNPDWGMPDDWVWRKVGYMNGHGVRGATAWTTDGEWCLNSFASTEGAHEVGDYLEFYQTVDLTDITAISFDVKLYTHDYTISYFAVDSDKLWTESTPGEYHGVTVDVSSYSGSHELVLGVEVTTAFGSGGTADGRTWFDTLAIDVTFGSTPIIDGVISPSEYTDANWLVFSTSGGDCTVYYKHDGTTLYVAFDVPNLDDESAVQIFVDPDNDGGDTPRINDYRFTISRRSGDNEYGENEGNNTDWGVWGPPPHNWIGAHEDLVSTWNAEFAIPYEKLGITPGVPDTIGIAFYNAWTATGDHAWPGNMHYMMPSTWRTAVSSDLWSLPIPAVSEWGLVVMLLLVLAAGTIVIRRRRAAVA